MAETGGATPEPQWVALVLAAVLGLALFIKNRWRTKESDLPEDDEDDPEVPALAHSASADSAALQAIVRHQFLVDQGFRNPHGRGWYASDDLPDKMEPGGWNTRDAVEICMNRIKHRSPAPDTAPTPRPSMPVRPPAGGVPGPGVAPLDMEGCLIA